MDAGKLRHRVTIEQPVWVQDTNTGEMTTTWSTFATVWASIEPLSARDLIAAQSGQSKVSVRISIRYLENIDPVMRISHGGKIYNIEGILPDQDSGLEYMTMPCSEGVRSE